MAKECSHHQWAEVRPRDNTLDHNITYSFSESGFESTQLELTQHTLIICWRLAGELYTEEKLPCNSMHLPGKVTVRNLCRNKAEAIHAAHTNISKFTNRMELLSLKPVVVSGIIIYEVEGYQESNGMWKSETYSDLSLCLKPLSLSLTSLCEHGILCHMQKDLQFLQVPVD